MGKEMVQMLIRNILMIFAPKLSHILLLSAQTKPLF